MHAGLQVATRRIDRVYLPLLVTMRSSAPISENTEEAVELIHRSDIGAAIDHICIKTRSHKRLDVDVDTTAKDRGLVVNLFG